MLPWQQLWILHVRKIQWFYQQGEGFCMHVFSSIYTKRAPLPPLGKGKGALAPPPLRRPWLYANTIVHKYNCFDCIYPTKYINGVFKGEVVIVYNNRGMGRNFGTGNSFTFCLWNMDRNFLFTAGWNEGFREIVNFLHVKREPHFPPAFTTLLNRIDLVHNDVTRLDAR